MCSFSFCTSSPGLLYMFMFTLFHPWSYLMQYDQHYIISTTEILNFILKKVFWDEKLGRRDWRFSQNTIYSYPEVNLNYSWFLHRISTSRSVMLVVWVLTCSKLAFWTTLRHSGYFLSINFLQYSTLVPPVHLHLVAKLLGLSLPQIHL